MQVSRADHGQWMCLINDNKNFDSVKQFVSLDVGVIPDTGISIEAGSLYEAITETRVEVVEGDNIALSCYARQGFPPSLVSWEHDITNDTSLRHVMMMVMMMMIIMVMMMSSVKPLICKQNLTKFYSFNDIFRGL